MFFSAFLCPYITPNQTKVSLANTVNKKVNKIHFNVMQSENCVLTEDIYTEL